MSNNSISLSFLYIDRWINLSYLTLALKMNVVRTLKPFRSLWDISELVQEFSPKIEASLLLLLSHFSHVQLCTTLWTATRRASLSINNNWSLLKLMSIESVMPSNHLILCRPLLLLPSIFLSIRVFSNKSVLRIRWPKYWSLSISPSSEYSGLISFKIDWFDLLTVQVVL